MTPTAGLAVFTPSSSRCSSGSLNLSAESMTRVGSAGSTVLGDRVTLGLAPLGMLAMFFEVLRLVLCRLGAGSGVLSGSLIISLLWELDILFEMLVGKYNTADVVINQNGVRLISIL